MRRIHRWNFQHGNEARALILGTVQMAPRISAFGFWVTDKGKNLNVTPPNGLSTKQFMDWHGFNVNRTATVQVLNCHLNLR